FYFRDGRAAPCHQICNLPCCKSPFSCLVCEGSSNPWNCISCPQTVSEMHHLNRVFQRLFQLPELWDLRSQQSRTLIVVHDCYNDLHTVCILRYVKPSELLQGLLVAASDQ